MNELVSIIIPTYKRPLAFLQRAVESILAQTYPNIEIIIVDENTTIEVSNYRKAVQKYVNILKNHVHIQYIQNDCNLGAALSRNKGVHLAHGNYVSFLDDDDIYLPCKIEKQLTYMLDNNLDMCFTNFKYCNEKNETVDVREHSRLKSLGHADLIHYHIPRHITGTLTFMFKKEVFERIGGFPNAVIAEEYYLMANTIESGCKIGYLPRTDAIAYRHNQGCVSYGSQKLPGEMALYQFKKKYFNQLSWRERMFIRFRHYAIIGIFYKRNKKPIKSMGYLLFAALASPVDVVIEGTNLLTNIKKY